MMDRSKNRQFTTLIRTLLLLSLCFGCMTAFVCFAQSAGNQSAGNDEQVYFAATKKLYDFDQWPGSRARDGLPIASLEFAGYEREPIQFVPAPPLRLRYADSKSPRFLIELSVCETVAEAHEKLITHLFNVSSPNQVPKAMDLGIAAGDIGYVGRAPADALSWIAFVRGNILVRVCNLDPRVVPQPPMRRVAEQVDRVITAQPLLDGKRKPSCPTLDLRCAGKAACVAGETIPLILDVQSPSKDPAAITWVVGGPGQGYVEKDTSGQFNLHTTKRGAIRLVCHVLGDRCTVATKQIDLTVE